MKEMFDTNENKADVCVMKSLFQGNECGATEINKTQ